jgi:hypothetical protein
LSGLEGAPFALAEDEGSTHHRVVAALPALGFRFPAIGSSAGLVIRCEFFPFAESGGAVGHIRIGRFCHDVCP